MSGKFELEREKKGAMFKITLSSKFNSNYYTRLVISKNTTSSTKKCPSEVIKSISTGDVVYNEFDFLEGKRNRPLQSKVFTESSGKCVCGFIYDLSPETNYTFYAYAQARDKNWYKVGESARVNPKDDDKLVMQNIEKYYEDEDFVADNKNVAIRVNVINKGEETSSPYFVRVYEGSIAGDNYMNTSDSNPGLNSGDNADLKVKIKSKRSGHKRYYFRLVSSDGAYLDKDGFNVIWEKAKSEEDLLGDLEKIKNLGSYSHTFTKEELLREELIVNCIMYGLAFLTGGGSFLLSQARSIYKYKVVDVASIGGVYTRKYYCRKILDPKQKDLNVPVLYQYSYVTVFYNSKAKNNNDVAHIEIINDGPPKLARN